MKLLFSYWNFSEPAPESELHPGKQLLAGQGDENVPGPHNQKLEELQSFAGSRVGHGKYTCLWRCIR